MWPFPKKNKKPARGMFDHIGRFQIDIYLRGGVTISKWLKFYSDSLSNKRLCTECFVDDGVWQDQTFHPKYEILRVEITDKVKMEDV